MRRSIEINDAVASQPAEESVALAPLPLDSFTPRPNAHDIRTHGPITRQKGDKMNLKAHL